MKIVATVEKDGVPTSRIFSIEISMIAVYTWAKHMTQDVDLKFSTIKFSELVDNPDC